MNAATPLHPDTKALDLRSWWMPFTHNRYFKSHPRLISSARGVVTRCGVVGAWWINSITKASIVCGSNCKVQINLDKSKSSAKRSSPFLKVETQ